MAAPYKYDRGQKIKAAGGAVDMGFIAHVELSTAETVAADADGVITIEMGAAKKTVKTGFEDMPAARNLTVVGTAAGITGTLKVTGTNMAGEAITESFTLNGTTAPTGSKAFASVTEVECPARHAADDAVNIGWGVKFGIPYKLGLNTVLAAYVNGSKEGTAPTVAVSTSALESNTISMNTAPSGKATHYYLIV